VQLVAFTQDPGKAYFGSSYLLFLIRRIVGVQQAEVCASHPNPSRNAPRNHYRNATGIGRATYYMRRGRIEFVGTRIRIDRRLRNAECTRVGARPPLAPAQAQKAGGQRTRRERD
jgi:hypothetical protein